MNWLMIFSTVVIVGGVAVSYQITGRQETRIEYSVAPDTEADRVAITRLVDRYYDGLRAGRFGEVAMMYSASAAEAIGGRVALARALKGASDLLGVPAKIELHGVRLDGDKARGEIILPEQSSAGQYRYEVNGKVVGTWAKTMHFVRVGDGWQVSDESENTAGINVEEAMKLLEQLEGLRSK